MTAPAVTLKTNVKLPLETWRAIKVWAAQHDMSRDEAIEQAIKCLTADKKGK